MRVSVNYDTIVLHRFDTENSVIVITAIDCDVAEELADKLGRLTHDVTIVTSANDCNEH